MYDVTTIGSATQDVFLIPKDIPIITSKKFITGRGECFSLGAKVEVQNIVFDTGGGATNAAVTLKRAGLKTAIFTRIGHDPAGTEIIRVLKKEKVAVKYINYDSGHCTAYSSVLLTPEGERTILVYRGASNYFPWDEFPIRKLETKWLYVTSLGGNQEFFNLLTQWALTNNVKIAWNPGSAEIAWGWETIEDYGKLVEMLIVNREEASLLAKKLFDNWQGTYLTLRRSKFPIIIVTDGKNGASAWLEKERYRVDTTGHKPINTTGAGDAFGSAFLAGLIKFKGDVPLALRLGAYNSGLVVTQMGAKHGIMKRIPGLAVLKKIKVEEE